MRVFLTTYIVLLLFPTALRAQHLTVAEADSLQLLLRQKRTDTVRVKILLRLSSYYIRKTWDAQLYRDTAFALAREAKSISISLRYRHGTEEAVFLEGRIWSKADMIRQVNDMLPHVSNFNQVRLLLELGKQHLVGTNTRALNWQSALKYFEKSENLSAKIGNSLLREESQRLLGYTYMLQEDTLRAKRYYEKVISARRNAGDMVGELMAILKIYNFESLSSLGCGDCQQSVTALTRALILARHLGNHGNEILCLNLLAYYHKTAKNFKAARRLAEESLALQRRVGYKVVNGAWHALTDEAVFGPQYLTVGVSDAHFILASLAESANRFDQALDHYMQVVKGLQDAGLYEELAFPYFSIGRNYLGLNEVAKSIEYFRQSLQISRRKDEAAVLYVIFRLFPEALVMAGNAEEALQFIETVNKQNIPMPLGSRLGVLLTLGHCYSALKQFDRAKPFYREAILRSQQVTKPRNLLTINLSTARFYVQIREYRQARLLLNKVYTTINDERGGTFDLILMEAHMLMFKIDSASGNYPSAIRYYQRHIAVKDSIFNQAKSKQMEEMTLRYETEKKDRDLQIKEKSIQVLRKEKALHQEEIQQAKLLRNAMIVGAAMLMLLLAVVYNRYQLKQQSNKRLHAQQATLEEQQEQIREKNHALEILLTDKERLLKEIHHRVKNNLQVVISLFNSQVASLQDKAALSAIQDSQNRVHAIALIHQKLYQAEGVSRILMNEYVEQIVAYLVDSYAVSNKVNFKLVVEPFDLDVNIAVPLGLIINEAITNTFKYAFPGDRTGAVIVTLLQQSEGKYRLNVQDNGVGLANNYDYSHSSSLGMKLMHGFTSQIGGELSIESNQGVKIDLVFTDEKYQFVKKTNLQM